MSGFSALLLVSGAPALQSALPPELEASGNFATIEIQHPIASAIMPQNMPAPVALWKTNLQDISHWSGAFKAAGREWFFDAIPLLWHPPEADWREIKKAAGSQPIEFILGGFGGPDGEALKARSSVSFRVSAEAVDTPLFFREVNLPFSEAVKDPSKIRWRFGPLDKGAPPPIVLEHLPVCGNCHSFSRNGEILAMDVDYANNKASYVITRTAPEMRLATSDIITWDDYRRQDGQQTFGLLSQISPDGRHVLSTVKDRSVFVPKPDLAFSQLFFPLQGILACYDRDTKEFASLPGADDPQYVQSNPSWSPDGQWVVFARNRAARLEKLRDSASILLTPEECEEFLKHGKEFRYDLYRLSFNDGKGGKPEPVRGASANGRSNYFPRYSPDGRWIIFCQASNYMLLQPDSELYIIPAEGGTARRLACNLNRMNSWHSWSPDGKWLVFSSKAHSDYTQLYLTRINEQGEASPPVWLAHLVEPGRAANIPEFVALPPQGIVKIHEQFLDDYSYTRSGNEFYRAGEADNAIDRYRKALSLNPDNAMAHQRLGFLLFLAKHQLPEALEHSQAAVRLEPRNGFAQYDLGSELVIRGDLSNAVVHLAEAVRLLPNGYDRQYNAIDLNYSLAEAQYRLGQYQQCIPALEAVLKHNAAHSKANYMAAMARAWLGETETTTTFFDVAVHLEPRLAQLPDYYDLVSRNYVAQGRFADGLKFSEQASNLARAAHRPEQAAKLEQRAQFCKNQLAGK